MRFLLYFLAFIILVNANFGAPKANYDESKVPQIKLPNILSIPGGSFTAESALDWNQKVRPALADIFENKIYGEIPPRPAKEVFEVVEASDDALGGKAIRRQIKITVADAKGEKSFIMLLYLPKSKAPSPVFLGLNFMGNHATTKDPNVIMPNWVRNTSTGKIKITDNKPTEESRGMQGNRWPFEKIVERGFGIATIYYCDIYPDLEKYDGAPQSIYSIFEKPLNGAISAWSWGLSRALDALETIPGGRKKCNSHRPLAPRQNGASCGGARHPLCRLRFQQLRLHGRGNFPQAIWRNNRVNNKSLSVLVQTATARIRQQRIRTSDRPAPTSRPNSPPPSLRHKRERRFVGRPARRTFGACGSRKSLQAFRR